MPWGPRNDWSEKDIAFLKAARKNRVPFKEIGESLGRTENAAWSKWRLLESTPNRKIGEAGHQYREIEPASNPNAPDSSTPKFAHHDLHLRLMAEAMRRGEHLPRRAAA